MRDFGVAPDQTLSKVDAARHRLYVEQRVGICFLGTKSVTGTDSSRRWNRQMNDNKNWFNKPSG